MTMRTKIKLSPLKRDTESIFNPHNIDTDCDTIANLLCSFKEVINKDMAEGNYRQAFDTFLEILEFLSYHFVEDEHFCYFDDSIVPTILVLTYLSPSLHKSRLGKFLLMMLLSLIKV